MDPNKISFKSTKIPDFKAGKWSFFFEGMRAYNEYTDQWFRINVSKANIEAQLYPHGFFWQTIIAGDAMKAFSDAYAEYVLLGED
jgi:hypothetical protein